MLPVFFDTDQYTMLCWNLAHVATSRCRKPQHVHINTRTPVACPRRSTRHTHTHTRLTALCPAYPGCPGKEAIKWLNGCSSCPGLPGWAVTRKVKPIWILLKQETVSGSGISWAMCKSPPRSRQITTPAPHPSVFLQAGCPSFHPTNSVKALKAKTQY